MKTFRAQTKQVLESGGQVWSWHTSHPWSSCLWQHCFWMTISKKKKYLSCLIQLKSQKQIKVPFVVSHVSPLSEKWPDRRVTASFLYLCLCHSQFYCNTPGVPFLIQCSVLGTEPYVIVVWSRKNRKGGQPCFSNIFMRTVYVWRRSPGNNFSKSD